MSEEVYFQKYAHDSNLGKHTPKYYVRPTQDMSILTRFLKAWGNYRKLREILEKCEKST